MAKKITDGRTATELIKMSTETKQMLKDIAEEIAESNNNIQRNIVVGRALLESGAHQEELKSICKNIVEQYNCTHSFVTSILNNYMFFIGANIFENGEIKDLGSNGVAACDSLCQYVVGTNSPLAIDDYRDTPWVYDMPGVTETGAFSYLGAPWEYEGITIGSVCLLDNKPRHWTDEERAGIKACANEITEIIKNH